MPNNPTSARVETPGTYVWRRGWKIEIERKTDRFTAVPVSAHHPDPLRGTPGVRAVNGITSRFFWVEPGPTARDATLAALRSETDNAVAHRAYHPKGAEGTVYRFKDKLVVTLVKRAASSKWSKEADVCALNDNFHLLDSQTCVPGRGVWAEDNEAYGEGFTAHPRYTGLFGGMSSATPLVAGVEALVLSVNPDLTDAEVEELLQSTADKPVDSNPDVVLGVSTVGAKTGAPTGSATGTKKPPRRWLKQSGD